MRSVSVLLAAVLLLASVTQSAGAQSKQAISDRETFRAQILKLGVGDKAKATITTKDGAKTKGYISQTGDDDFVIRDRKTNTPTRIRYADVTKVDGNRGHSVMRTVLICVGIGAAVTLVSVYAAIAANER